MPQETQKNTKHELTIRPPIAVIMGHIDHGKTTLLDHIRKTKVTESEAGGITQHMSAYEAKINGNKITFLDTPGHEAFSKIRSHGTAIADLAILVVAADDGIKEQTEEALAAIRQSNIPFMIAINKIDKENAAPDKIKKELSEKGIQIEEWGGKIPCVNISAKTGQGVDELLEMINLLAELEELKTDSETNASGYVLESHMDKKRGIAATLIIQNGALKQGMYIATENSAAPVRIFENFLGKPIKEAGASSPVKIIGFNKLPEPGSKFQSYPSKRDIAETNNKPDKSAARILTGPPKYEVFGGDKEKSILPIIIKADAQGSVDALKQQFAKLQTENVILNILRAGVGDITEDDAKLASGDNNAVIVGFNVKPFANAKIVAEKHEIKIEIFNIIYEAEDRIKKLINKMEEAVTKEKEVIIGKAKVLKIFRDEKNKKIIGGEVKTGKIATGKNVKIYRRDFLLGEGKILELKCRQEKIEEAKEGEQFGALLQTKAGVAPKDTLEFYD